MHTMKRIQLTFLFLFGVLVFVSTDAIYAWQTSGSVDFSVQTTTYNGRYSPRNVGVIWITDAQGAFVQTLKIWARTRAGYLTNWRSSSGENYVDAVTSATINSHQTHNVTWDCTDSNGNLVADGNYRIYMEFTENNSTGKLSYVEFSKSTSNQTLSPANDGNFINIQLSYIASAVVTPASLAGTITDSQSGSGVSGATVELLQGSSSVYNATTDGSGNYSIANIAAASYTLRVTASGYQEHSESITLSEGQAVTGKNIALSPQVASIATISGTIYQTGTTTAVSGASVRLLQNGQVIYETTSTSAGAYAFNNITAGSYSLLVNLTGYQNYSENINLNTGDNQSNHTIYLDQSIQVVAFSGTVSDANSHAMVTAAIVELLQNNAVAVSTTTNSSGAFEFTDLASGSYTLRVTKSGYQVYSQSLNIADGQNFTIHISLVPLNAYASVSGAVFNAATNQIIADVSVQLQQNSAVVYQTSTNASGNYAFVDIAAATYDIVLQKAGYESIAEYISFNAGDIISQKNFSMTPEGQADTTGAPGTPGGLIAVLNGSQALLSWNASPQPDVVGYFVHIGAGNENYTQKIDVQNTLSYQTAQLASDTRYYFAVSAYDASGYESVLSTSVNVLISGNSGTLTPPGNLTVTLNGAQALLSWSASPSAGVTGYNVHIGSGSENFTQKIDVQNTLSYQSAQLTAGTRYYFAVSAYDASGVKVFVPAP